jgi:hypothetical protein
MELAFLTWVPVDNNSVVATAIAYFRRIYTRSVQSLTTILLCNVTFKLLSFVGIGSGFKNHAVSADRI